MLTGRSLYKFGTDVKCVVEICALLDRELRLGLCLKSVSYAVQLLL